MFFDVCAGSGMSIDLWLDHVLILRLIPALSTNPTALFPSLVSLGPPRVEVTGSSSFGFALASI